MVFKPIDLKGSDGSGDLGSLGLGDSIPAISLKICYYNIPTYPKDHNYLSFFVPSLKYGLQLYISEDCLTSENDQFITMCQYFVDLLLHPDHEKFSLVYIIDNILLLCFKNRKLQKLYEKLMTCLSVAVYKLAQKKIRHYPCMYIWAMFWNALHCIPKKSLSENLRTLNDFQKLSGDIN